MTHEYDDDSGEEWIEDEGEDSDEADLLLCPSCRRLVHEDTQQCPSCGDWITPVYPSGGARHWVWVVAVELESTAFVRGMVR